MSGRSENTSTAGSDPARPPLTDSPIKRNFDSNITPSSTPPPVPPKDAATLPSPRVKTFQDENIATQLPLSKPANVYQHGSIGRNAQRLKKLPSLHEIGKVYIENGGSPVNRFNPTFEQPLGPLSTKSKKPTLDRLLPVASTQSPPNHKEADKLSKTLSPYTANPSAESPSRLKLPLSALTRVDTFAVADNAAKGGMTKATLDDGAKEMEVPAPRAVRQTIQIPTTNPSKDDSTPHISASMSSALPTPLITPQDSKNLGDPDQVKIVKRLGHGESVSPADVPGGNYVKGYKNLLSWKEVVDVRKVQQGGDKGAKTMENQVPAQTPQVTSGVSALPRRDVKHGLHPLQHTWTLYHDTGRPITDQDMLISQSGTTLSMKLGRTNADEKKNKIEMEFESRLLILGEFRTVEDFGRMFGQTPDQKRNCPSQMNSGSNLHLFKDGIRPMYEDPANKQGGRWTLVLQNLPGLLDRVWQNLVCGMIGEQIDEGDDVCGAVISIRPKVQRIQVWVRNKNNFDTVEQIGQTLLRVLDIAESNVVTSFEFAGNLGPPASDRPHLQIGKVIKNGPRLAQPHGPPGGFGAASRASSLMGSAPASRRNSPTQSGFVNPFAGPLGMPQPGSPRTSSLRSGRSGGTGRE